MKFWHTKWKGCLKNGIKETNISAAGGPCLAKELANKAHTSVVFANNDIKVAKEISKLVVEKQKVEEKLGNEKFLSRAPEEIVEEQRERLMEYKANLSNLQTSLDQLVRH